MATPLKTNSSPASATASKLPSGLFSKVLWVLLVGIPAWLYQAAVQPAPAKILGSPGGPPVTGPRIQLRDGRHLAYREHGVSKDKANYKIIYLHPFGSCRHDPVLYKHVSQEFAEKLGVYIVSFDRPGHGESDPHPTRTLKSLTMDIEELADQLGLGSKFYIVGYSMGGLFTWTCLKYIPHRLAGVSLLTPAINYWWPGFPANLSSQVFSKMLPQDQWAYRIAHHAPWLAYWYSTLKWFAPSAIEKDPVVLSKQDREIAPTLDLSNMGYARQQGDAESIIRDAMVAFGNWEFDTMDLPNPFPNNEGSVHLWQGDEDGFISAELQRYIVQKLPWIRYHELAGSGHMFGYLDGMFEKIVQVMLTGQE